MKKKKRKIRKPEDLIDSFGSLLAWVEDTGRIYINDESFNLRDLLLLQKWLARAEKYLKQEKDK